MLPENYQPKPITVVISLVLLLALLVYGVTTFVEEKKAFSSGAKYTIGFTTDIYFTTSGRSVNYRYEVNGIEYEGSSGYAYNSIVPNGRYWVKYSIEKPSISEIYQDKPVSQNVKSAPPGGFDFMMK